MRLRFTDVRARILVATVAGLALRLAWWWYAHPEPVSDFEYYRRTAVALLTHHQFGYPRPVGRAPGYPLFLAAVMLFGRSIAWLSIANVLLSTALVPVVGRLALRLTAWPAAAVAAAWVVAVDPTFVCFAPVLASEHLFAVLLMAAMLVALEAADAAQLEGAAPPSTSMFVNVAVAGTLLGAAALARADAIFYAPIVVVVLWRGAGRRVVAPAACLLAAAMVLTPWYVRNRLVIGPGAGLSTAGGLTFYYGHNSRAYGWHPLEGTPLEGLDEAALQTRGYQLGFAYLAHAGWGQIVSDIEKGTRAQYLPSYPFSFIWATRSAGGTPDETSQKALPGYDALYRFADGAYQYLLWGAGLSLLFVRRYPRRASFVLYGMVVVNWTAHCVVFLGEARYRYPAEVACCVLFALFALEAFTTMRRIVPAVVRMSRR